jgi:hypothetical protein
LILRSFAYRAVLNVGSDPGEHRLVERPKRVLRVPTNHAMKVRPRRRG